MSNFLDIIFENNDILVLNKPAGISVHGDGKTPLKTVADFIVEQYPALKEVGEPLVIEHKGEQITISKPGIVHRLDKDTSGVLIIAKNQPTFLFLKEQFMNRNVQKTYHALVYGWPKEDKGSIDEPIGRAKTDIRKWTAGKGARGVLREAHTSYEVLARYSEDDREYTGSGSTEADTCAYVEVSPKTGRTHQIRVHMKYINHPLVCDSLYAPDKPNHLGFTRLALHAKSLTIALPNGEEQTFEAPFPKDFEHAREILAL